MKNYSFYRLSLPIIVGVSLLSLNVSFAGKTTPPPPIKLKKVFNAKAKCLPQYKKTFNTSSKGTKSVQKRGKLTKTFNPVAKGKFSKPKRNINKNIKTNFGDIGVKKKAQKSLPGNVEIWRKRNRLTPAPHPPWVSKMRTNLARYNFRQHWLAEKRNRPRAASSPNNWSLTREFNNKAGL